MYMWRIFWVRFLDLVFILLISIQINFVFSLSPTLGDFLRLSSFPPKLNSKSQSYVRSLQLTQNWFIFNGELITGGCWCNYFYFLWLNYLWDITACRANLLHSVWFTSYFLLFWNICTSKLSFFITDYSWGSQGE